MADGSQEATMEFEPAYVPEDQIIVPLSRVPEKPEPTPYVPSTVSGKKPLIINIETSGLTPWEDRIITIGIQDPEMPSENPTIIMRDDEEEMLRAFFTVIKDFGYNQAVGYGFSFDYRFIVLRAMYYQIPCKEFVDMDIYDLGQAMAQVKMAFVYFAQKQPPLSDIADFFWDYPKPFTDAEMLKYWTSGATDKVLEFASSQVTRTLLLYLLFRAITETPFATTALGAGSGTSSFQTTPNELTKSLLTIPEANAPQTVKWKCPYCLQEYDLPVGQVPGPCAICGTELKKV